MIDKESNRWPNGVVPYVMDIALSECWFRDPCAGDDVLVVRSHFGV